MRVIGCVLAFALLFSPDHLAAKGNRQFLTSIKDRVVRGLGHSVIADKARWQKLMLGVGVVVTCLGASCSSTIERGAVQQGQLSQADIAGQHVHAIVDGQSYLGHVSQVVSSDEITLSLYSGTELVVTLAEVSGTIYLAHEDLGKAVILPSEDLTMHGLVTSVYSDGYYQVMVGAQLDASGEVNILDDRLTVVVHVNNLEFLED